MTWATPFRNAATRFGDRTALIHGERRWSFRSFMRDVDALCLGLSSRLQPGDRVILFMANRAEYLLLQVALECCGLVRVPLNARYTAFEVANLAADSQAAALFFDDTTAERVAGLDQPGLWLCPVNGESAWRELLRGDGGSAGEAGDLDALCSINYTSGSSGKPKGVMLSQRNWRGVTRNMLIDRDIRTDDVIAHIGPLTHASGTYFTPFFLRGATNVIVEGGQPENLIADIARHRVTGFTCVPTVLTRLVNHPDLEGSDLSSLRWIGYGAEPVFANTLVQALDRFGPILTQNYGLTEAMMTCSRLQPDEHLRPGDGAPRERLRQNCIGRPYSFVEIVLRDPEGQPVPTGEVGEITIRAEHVMQGYWGRPQETAKTLRDGWLWSGDLGVVDEDGFITLVGRSKDVVISGGFKIYPPEVEACLTSLPGIMEAAVIGAPDSGFGEIAVAVVAAKPGYHLTEGACQSYCRPRLGIKTPKRWIFVETLPKTANGKIDKGLLRATYGQGNPA